MTRGEIILLLNEAIVHTKSHNPPSAVVNSIVAKIEFLRSLVERGECQQLVQLIVYVLYVSEIDLTDNRGLQ